MNAFRNRTCFLFTLLLLPAVVAAPVDAAVKVNRPVQARDQNAQSAAPSASAPPLLLEEEDSAPTARAGTGVSSSPAGDLAQVGQVIFARGSQVVAELETDVVNNEYLLVFDSSFRNKGSAVVVQPLRDNTYLLRGVGTWLTEGDRLSRESELQAAARVLRQKTPEGYRSFLARFPNSSHQPRVARELFRTQMQTQYPARPGSVLSGTLRLAETVSQPIPMEDVQVVLDRFVLALTTSGGQYRIEGVPLPEVPVTVRLKVKDTKFHSAGETTLDLPADRTLEMEKDLPVVLAPTVLSGTVVDAGGDPLAGAEVWTAPYTLEYLTGENGSFQISRRKNLNDPTAVDQPLLGGAFEVYASRSGYSVERVRVKAESFATNPVPALRLSAQNTRNEAVPELTVALRDHLRPDPSALAGSAGVGPMINP